MATKTIAAYNSPAEKKAIADYVCDGSADQEEINAAINSGAYDIMLFEGTYNITGSIHVRGGTVFSGEGAEKTFLKLTNNAHLFLSSEYTVARDFNIEGTGYTNSTSVWLGVLTVRASHCTVYRVKGTADNTPGCVFYTLSSEDTPGTLLQDVEWNECECVDTGTYGFLHNWWDGQVEKRAHVNMRYINCKAIRCGNANGTASKGQRNNWVTGFDFAELNDIDGLYVKGCSAEGCWESGFHMEWDPHKVNCVFEDCVSKFNGAKPTYPNQTVNPFPGFVTGAGEFFGCGYYLPNFVGSLTRCYSEGNSRCGFWVTNGGVLTDCTDKDCGIGRTPNEYLQPMSFMGNPCRTPFEGYSLKLIRCKSINSRCYAFWYDYAAYIYMEDCEVYGGQGYNGVLNYFGSEASNYFYDSNISFARIECPANLTAINAHQNIRVKYGPGVLVSDAAKPFTITGSSTNSVLVENWTTVSQTLTPGPGGVFLEEGASSAQVTQNNVVIIDTDPGVPPVEPIVAEVSVFRRAETYQVVATIQKIVATTYSDIYSVTGAISHVGPISAFTEVIIYLNRVQVVQSSIRPINGSMRSYGIPYVAAPDGPGVFAAEDLQIEVRDNDGALIAILDNAHNIRVVQEDNTPTILEFDLPADDRKGDNLTLANEIWVRSIKTGGIVAKFILHKKTDTRGI
jgi:hypothetical protein